VAPIIFYMDFIHWGYIRKCAKWRCRRGVLQKNIYTER